MPSPRSDTTPAAPVATSEHAPILGHGHFGHGAEKVLVFHDWMGDAANYEPLLPYLDPNAFTYVFADVRGYGKSRHLTGDYSAGEVAADGFRLADKLGWQHFHLIGHSMTGMAVQRMALDDWTSGARRLKRVVAITPVAANGYPADEGTKQFLWNLIHERNLSEQGFSLLTGQRLSPTWSRFKTNRHFQTSTEEALKGYYRMWLESDFSQEVRQAGVGTPFQVIGGRQDLPGFQEEHLRKTFGAWYASVQFAFITDAGHYPMHETPVYLASLIEQFLGAGSGNTGAAAASNQNPTEQHTR
ncbi:MAG: alpha/beta hydrolase [Limisphaerales bacterium]|nr:MAG: alpha/beta hydrolase [Limisphaerales bacterium]TXT45693.1 MAG: alpha/beta hydrolase [Limisphaerales bacterium]